MNEVGKNVNEEQFDIRDIFGEISYNLHSVIIRAFGDVCVG